MNLKSIKLETRGFQADFSNDISLVELKRIIVFNDYIVPICLPSSADMESIDRLVILGYG